MDKKEIDALTLQIQKICANQPLLPSDRWDDPALADLQDGIAYLAQCSMEALTFLQQMATGMLDIQPPSRHNFLAGSLKELQSGLLHLSWQAQQVAHGDYHQRVNFLGSFSESFNMMTQQLEEREGHLKSRAADLEKSKQLLVSVLNVVKNWVVVVEQESQRVIYANRAARPCYPVDTSVCKPHCPLVEQLHDYRDSQDHHCEYACPISGRVLSVDSFHIVWDGAAAFVHIVADITQTRAKEAQLENMAYLDEMTGLYNRRYCLTYLTELLQGENRFTICFLDLDRLKYVNDNFGHGCGDEYITSVVEQFKRSTRITDILCRIGGDEFLLLLPNCDEAHALSKMEEIGSRVKALNKGYPTSVSYGILCVEDLPTTQTPELLLRLVDEKMYAFKNQQLSNLPPKRELV